LKFVDVKPLVSIKGLVCKIARRILTPRHLSFPLLRFELLVLLDGSSFSWSFKLWVNLSSAVLIRGAPPIYNPLWGVSR